MGHIRLGRLPKTRRWNEVVDLLAESPALTGAVAAAATRAADRRLSALASDQAVNYAFWLLTRIAWASHSEAFFQELETIGLQADPSGSTLSFISDLSDRVRDRNADQISSGHFA